MKLTSFAARLLLIASLAIDVGVVRAALRGHVPPYSGRRNAASPRVAQAAVLYSAPIRPACTHSIRFLVDHAGSRVLVSANGDAADNIEVHLYWLRRHGLVPTRIGGSQINPYTDGPYAVDYLRGWVYADGGPTISGQAGLLRTSFDGRHTQLFDQAANWMSPCFVVPRASADAVDEVAFPHATDVSSPSARLRTYVDGKQAGDVPLGALPDAALYAWQADRLFFVYGNHVKEWKGRLAVNLPGPMAAAAGRWPIDITPDGAYIYWADPGSRVVSKILVSNGAVVARRRVDFKPAALALQGTTGRLLLAGVSSHSVYGRIDTICVIRRF